MSDNIKILLHSARSGEKINKDIVSFLWDQINNDKAARGLFKSMSITDSIGLEDFFNDEMHIIAVSFYDGELASIVWLDCIADKTARIHFVTFSWTYRGINLETCKEAVKKLFETGMFDCFIGFTPMFNKLALNFIGKVGFVPSGVIPLGFYDKKENKSVDALCTYCTRGMI